MMYQQQQAVSHTHPQPEYNAAAYAPSPDKMGAGWNFQAGEQLGNEPTALIVPASHVCKENSVYAQGQNFDAPQGLQQVRCRRVCVLAVHSLRSLSRRSHCVVSYCHPPFLL